MRRQRTCFGEDRPMGHRSAPTGISLKLLRKLHQTIAKITLDFEGRWHFNTTIAAIMELVNEIQAADAQLAAGDVPPPVVLELLRSLVLLLAPFAPYLVAELWEELGEEGSVLRAPWPVADAELAREDELEIPVQINGKLVTVVRVPPMQMQRPLRSRRWRMRRFKRASRARPWSR
jgi:leucyl-tRNA synthetase